MKATGIVRRIDDLGRVVIPKEIRRTMRIREGDPLEIILDNNMVCYKKYQPLNDIQEYADKFVAQLYKQMNGIILISDIDNIIAAAGVNPKRDYEGKPLSDAIITVIQNRKTIIDDNIDIVDFDNHKDKKRLIVPIISEAEIIGSIIVLKDEFTEIDKSVVQIIANVLGTQCES